MAVVLGQSGTACFEKIKYGSRQTLEAFGGSFNLLTYTSFTKTASFHALVLKDTSLAPLALRVQSCGCSTAVLRPATLQSPGILGL